MNPITLNELKRLGLRPGTSFEELMADADARSAFEEITGLELALEFPLLVDGSDPCFVTFARVGDGTEYGFYVYPPMMNALTSDAVVQWDHEGPSIELEALDFGEWLQEQIKDAPEGDARALLSKLGGRPPPRELDPEVRSTVAELLPTSMALAGTGPIRRFLEKPPPSGGSALAEYERQWNRSRLSSVFADGVDDADTTLLLAFGIETYRRLGWSLPFEALSREDQQLGLRAEEQRPKHEALLWAKVHPPTAGTLAHTVPDALKGSAFAGFVVEEWIRGCSFDRSLFGGPAEDGRQLLGEHLVGALSKAATEDERHQLASWLVDLAWAQAADLTGRLGLAEVSAKLKTAGEVQELGRRHAGKAKDWSGLK